MPNGLTVTLGVGGAAYQKTLTTNLLQAGMLRRVMKTGPRLEIQDPGPEGSLNVIERFPTMQFVNRALWGVWRRLPQILNLPQPATINVILVDELWSRWIPPCTIFHGWMGFSLASLQVAKRQGALALIENAGRHPRHWEQVAQEEYAHFDVPRAERRPLLGQRLVRRMEREYELCNCIAVPSSLAHHSFAEFGLGKKAVVVLLGTDTQFFSPPLRAEQSRLFRVLFVGRVELAKGIGYLLQAWRRLSLPNAELVLVGEIKREMNSLLRTYADSTVRTTGPQFPEQVAARYKESSLFVLPSANEGLAQVMLEAMSSGLPVITTNMSGAYDCMEDRKEGLIVPARDVDALADAILWCYRHPDESRAMGQAARARIESQFTLEHYNQRQIALYRRLAAIKGAA